MSKLSELMQGTVHSARARERNGTFGMIPWRTVEKWIPLAKALENPPEPPPLPIDGQLAEYDDLREAR